MSTPVSASPHAFARATAATLVLLGFATLPAPTPLHAQQRLVGGTRVGGGPVIQSWRFGEAVPLDSLGVRSATQLVLPIALETTLGRAWTASLTGAAVRGTIASHVLGAGGQSTSQTRELSGLTDLRLRATGRVWGEGLVVSLGLNLPTGAVGLDAGQTEALRVLGAPALDARAPVLGTGFGATAGVVAARQLGPWAWAAGAAYERRGRYTPLEAALVGGDAGAGTEATELDPGDAVHLSLGGDGVVGDGQMSVSLTLDLYGEDAVTFPGRGRAASADAVGARYRLGPTLGAAWQWQLAAPGFREFTVAASDRYRTAYTGPGDSTVTGSSGNYFDASVAGVVGAPGRLGLLLGAEVRQQTGLAADRGFIGAGLTAGGVTAGLVVPAGRTEWRPWVRATTGQLRTARLTTTITGLSAGLALSTR